MSGHSGRVNRRGHAVDVVVAEDGTAQTRTGERLSPGEFRWLPPSTGTVIGVALNIAAQVKGVQAQFHSEPYKAPPQHPVLFIKPAGTLCGHLAPVQHPSQVRSIQPGGALAVVIGTRAARVAARDAWDVIGGYTLFNDFQLPEDSFFRPPIKSKCLDSFGPMGPYVVPWQAVSDPRTIVVRTRVNGKARQETAGCELIHDIPALIEHITSFMTLSAGDVIVPAVPVQRIDVVAGDTVVVEAAGIGMLENRIVGEQEYYAALEAAA